MALNTLNNKHQSRSVSHTALSESPYPRGPVSIPLSDTMNPTTLWHLRLSIIILILLSLAYFFSAWWLQGSSLAWHVSEFSSAIRGNNIPLSISTFCLPN